MTRPDERTRPEPVRARVLPNAGLGALWGFAAGAAIADGDGADARALVDEARAVASHLMARGDYHDGEVARSPRLASAPALARLPRVVPIGLFWAGWPEKRRAVTVVDLGRDDLGLGLGAVMLNGILAAAVWHGHPPQQQLVAGLQDVDAVSLAWAAAEPDARALIAAENHRLRATVTAALGDARARGEDSVLGALELACWHLFHGSSPDVAAGALVASGRGAAHGAVLGAVIGAQVGLPNLPATWLDAGRAVGGEALADFVQTGPFLGFDPRRPS